MTRNSLIVSSLFALAVMAVPDVSAAAPTSSQGVRFSDAGDGVAQSVQYRRYGSCPPGWNFNYRVGRCIRWARDGYRDGYDGFRGRRYGQCPRGWDWNGYRCVRWAY